MKTKLLITVIAVFTLLGCSKAKDTLDAFDSVGCINTLTRLSNNDDDQNCAELISDLEKLERDCREFLDDDARASIALIKANCED